MNKDELRKSVEEIADFARDKCGLDFFDVKYEVVGHEKMIELISQEGFPHRLPHWRFGRDYYYFEKMFEHLGSFALETIVFGDIAVAYLLEDNPDIVQKAIIAHTIAHSDFSKNNAYFRHINKDSFSMFEGNRELIISIINKVGLESVEKFLDALYVMEQHVDIMHPYTTLDARVELSEQERKVIVEERLKLIATQDPQVERVYQSPAKVEAERQRIEKELEQQLLRKPFEQTKDVLGFLIFHAPDLLEWERNLIRVVREESMYFEPLRLTKIMDEGWATYWHDRIMREMDLIDDKVTYSHLMAKVLGNSKLSLTPYKLGFEFFKHMKEYGDKGRFLQEYYQEESESRRLHWNMNTKKGDELIRLAREKECDYTFIHKFCSPEFIRDAQFYIWQKKPKMWWMRDEPAEYNIASRDPDLIREFMLSVIASIDKVNLYVIEGDYQKKGQLYLEVKQDHNVPVKKKELEDVLKALYGVWRRPVSIKAPLTERPSRYDVYGKTSRATIKDMIASYDGKAISYIYGWT